MTLHIPASRIRGIRSARADASPAELFDQLRRTVETFKAEHKAELEGIKKNFADVVQTEKVDRINAEISTLNRALDDINASLAAIKLGGGGTGGGAEQNADVRAHRDAFHDWFRRGGDNRGDALQELAVKAMLTSQSKPDGGYLSPNTLESTINRVLGTVSALRGIAGKMSIGTLTYTKFVNQGGAGAGWVGEEESRPETSTPNLRELKFEAMELYAKPFTTQTMLDDGFIDIEQWLADEVAITFAEQEGAAFVTGNGIKRPRGILTHDTVANASWAWGKLGHIASGAAADFAATKPGNALIDLYYALKAGYRSNASWLMSDAVMGSIRKMVDGQGNYLWAPPTAAAEIATILGKPVHTDDNMPAIAADALPIAFGDFRRGYLILDRMGIRILRNPYSVEGKVSFYTTKRVGGGVSDFAAIKLLKITA